MKRKNIIFLVLILAVMVGVFLYFRNKKKQDQYLGNMLTSLPPEELSSEEQQVLDDLTEAAQRSDENWYNKVIGGRNEEQNLNSYYIWRWFLYRMIDFILNM